MKLLFKCIILSFLPCLILLPASENLFADSESIYDKAVGYYNSGKYKKSIELFHEYIKKKPESRAYYRIGYALYKLGEYEKANKYFDEAYLIDPSYSPELPMPEETYPEKIITGSTSPPVTTLTTEEIPAFPSDAEPQPSLKPETGEAITNAESSLMQETQKTSDTLYPGVPELPRPPADLPIFPKPPEEFTGIPPGTLPPGLVAGLGMTIIILEIAIYLYFCLCLFLIAKKLDVSAAWTAWIPLVQIWTIVSSARKPWWWILLLFIPVVNIVIGVYLWMCITENLGRNKWLALLMLLPIVNFIFIGILAFSKSQETGGVMGEQLGTSS